MQHTTRTFRSIPLQATDAIGDPVRTCAACRMDSGGTAIAASIAVGSSGAFGACDRDRHERRAIDRAGSNVTLVTLTDDDGTPVAELWANA